LRGKAKREKEGKKPNLEALVVIGSLIRHLLRVLEGDFGALAPEGDNFSTWTVDILPFCTFCKETHVTHPSLLLSPNPSCKIGEGQKGYASG
jgi:hypothetical protein